MFSKQVGINHKTFQAEVDLNKKISETFQFKKLNRYTLDNIQTNYADNPDKVKLELSLKNKNKLLKKVEMVLYKGYYAYKIIDLSTN